MIDNIIMVITVISSLTALYFSIKKQGHDTAKTDSDAANIDADTIKTLYGLINEQETRYKNYKIEQEACYAQLKRDFETYKNDTSAQIAEVVHENNKLRAWARRLCKQLEAVNIIPEKFEL